MTEAYHSRGAAVSVTAPPADIALSGDHGIILEQGDGSAPEVAVAAQRPGEHGVSLVEAHFRHGFYASGSARHHMIVLTERCTNRLACRVGDERLEHLPGAGNITISPAGAPVTSEGQGDYSGLVLFVPTDTLAFSAAERGLANASLVERCAGQDDVLMASGRAIRQIATPVRGFDVLGWTSLTAAIVDRLMERHLSSIPTPIRGRLGSADLAKINDFVEANLDQPFSVEQLADLTCHARSHFPRLFRRSFGLSPYQYVLRARLNRALTLLRRGRLSLAEIALRSGFADQSHLSRWIRQRYGFTPGQLASAS